MDMDLRGATLKPLCITPKKLYTPDPVASHTPASSRTFAIFPASSLRSSTGVSHMSGRERMAG